MSNMQRVKAHELREKNQEALLEELTKQRKDLATLRVSKVSSQPQVKLSKIKQVRKSIAKVLTVLSEKRIAAARSSIRKNEKCPHDLRKKRSHAFRRHLTKLEASAQRVKAQKRAGLRKMRKFAVRSD